MCCYFPGQFVSESAVPAATSDLDAAGRQSGVEMLAETSAEAAARL